MINIQTCQESEIFGKQREGLIKKVEMLEDRFRHKQSNENSSALQSAHREAPPSEDYTIRSIDNVFKNDGMSADSSVQKKVNYDKLDIIDSDKLSELLSSKKKHRYNKVVDSMEGIVEEPISHQINFDDQSYHKHEESKIYTEQEQSAIISEEPEEINEDTNSEVEHILGDSSQTEDEQSVHDEFNASIKPLSRATSNEKEKSPSVDKHRQERFSLYEEFEIKNSHAVIESLTYGQQCQEQNDIIRESVDSRQTVINCTQSNEHTEDENLSDRNIIADEFSLELPDNQHKTETTDEMPEVSVRANQQDRIDEEDITEGEQSESDHEQQSEIEQQTSRIEDESDYDENESNDQYQDQELVKEVTEENLYSEASNSQHERQYFNSTLTNMRIAFGSEQKIRENSVKTLEKMEKSLEESTSSKKPEDNSSIFEKKSFQDFSLKKFTELMQEKNVKKFQDSMQKTFREYSKAQILSMSDKKNAKSISSTPKKSRCVSPRRFSKRDLELDRIGSDHMRINSEKKRGMLKQFNTSNSSLSKQNSTAIVYNTNLSMEKYKKERTMQEFSEDAGTSVKNLEYHILSPKKRFDTSHEKLDEQPGYESPEPSKSFRSKQSSCKQQPREYVEHQDYDNMHETPEVDDNLETVKLDSSRLRSQKRGLSIDGKS